MIILKIIGVFWFSISSIFSNGSKENYQKSFCDSVENNIIEVDSSSSLNKYISYADYYYHIAYSELGNQFVYSSLLSILIDDASLESIDFVNNNAWYNGRFFKFVAVNLGVAQLTDNESYHRFRYSNNSIYILVYKGSSHMYECYGIKLRKFSTDDNLFFSEVYSFPWAGSSINDVPLSYFSSNNRFSGDNFGLKYQHYIVPPGSGNEQVNHTYTAFEIMLPDYSGGSYQVGYADGFVDGQNTRNQDDYNEGYQAGLVDGALENPEISAIFTGVLNVGLLPVNVFLEIFNFELFGINVSGLVSGLLTMSIVIIIIRFLFGGKNDK